MVIREQYLSQLDAWKNKDVIKVISGVRRCGKSTLMEQWRERLIERGVVPESILHINLELLENECLLEYHALHDRILEFYRPDRENYVLIDEVQNVPMFQKAIDSLYVRPNLDIYITGSNAFLLRGTLATLLSGRYVEIEMLPLSFKEYCVARSAEELSPRRLWSDYLHDGSLPAVTSIREHDGVTHDYLTGIIDTILLKDVAGRMGLSGTSQLVAMTSFMFDNIGNLSTAKGIADALTANGSKISSPTVADYLDALCASYIFYTAQRFDLRGRKLLKNEKKYYAVDLGMRRVACSNEVRDDGRMLENLVYLELRRREGEVYVGKGPQGEIDFVTNGADGRKYYQVAQSVENPETLERELSSFASIKDNYPKALITMDDVRPASHDGIKQVYALDWFLGR